MEKKLRSTSKAAEHRRAKLHISDAVEEMAKPSSEDNVDDTSLRSLSTATRVVKESGRAVSNEVSKRHQRKAIRDAQIAAAQQKKAAKEGMGTVAERVTDAANALKLTVVETVKKHPAACAFVLIGILFVMLFSGILTSCSAMFPAGTNTVLSAVYTAEDADILGANADYVAMENSLRSQINSVEASHPGYDEYRYETEDIGHNPYELASFLTVMFEAYTRAQVQDTLANLFDAQYDLSFQEYSETRYREEKRTRIIQEVDPESGRVIEIEEEYTVRVPYTYRILATKMENHGLGTVVGNSGLTEDEMERYAVLNQTRGGRPDLFANDPMANPIIPYPDYDVPPEALTDERFARMLAVAEQFLGYPYVWGGSSPSTSFDCSGFISWVVNHSGNGWDFGRCGCNALGSHCTYIRPEDAKPGDLIFFQGTYETDGFSHVGLYVGNGMMIHCGNPIQYASIETPYWIAHFAAFGRLP